MAEASLKSQFNAYEYIGIIAPGSVLCLGITLLWPDVKAAILNNEVTIGGFGIFIIVSFVIGHLLQCIGNLVESILWKFCGGMPTSWVLKSSQKLISKDQKTILEKMVLDKKHGAKSLSDYSSYEWASVVRGMYIVVSKHSNTARIDSFNRNYGLLRGIAAAFIILTVIFLIKDPSQYKTALLVAAFGIVPALYRMYRFGRNYGRELLVEYINVEKDKNG